MELYRKCNIFERLLSLSASPSLPESCSQKILNLLFRCTYVEGSSTLITRCGIVSWISSLLTSQSTSELVKARLRALAMRVYETSDQDRANDWSNGTLASILNFFDYQRVNIQCQQHRIRFEGPHTPTRLGEFPWVSCDLCDPFVKPTSETP